MKSLVTAIQQRDGRALQVMSNSAPLQQAQPVREHTAQVFNELFKQLRATFPASMANFKDQEDLNEFKRQWTKAFAENNIRTIDQINAGMKIARQQENPFLPAPGQFIQWCKQGESLAVGLPNEDQLYELYREYCKMRGWREMKWPSNACYWMVTKIYSEMRSKSLTDSEVKKLCAKELRVMTARIKSGETIPAPVKQIPQLHIPTSKEKSLEHLASIRKKLNLNPKSI